MKTRLIVRTLFACAMCAALAACGQKGPLRLPNPASPANADGVVDFAGAANASWPVAKP